MNNNLVNTSGTIAEEIQIVNNLFIANLKLLRASVGLSQKELALAVGISSRKIADMEEGKLPPTLADLVRLVEYFPITFDDLLDIKLELDIPSRRRNINI